LRNYPKPIQIRISADLGSGWLSQIKRFTDTG